VSSESKIQTKEPKPGGKQSKCDFAILAFTRKWPFWINFFSRPTSETSFIAMHHSNQFAHAECAVMHIL
jgi:hypothetical protein